LKLVAAIPIWLALPLNAVYDAVWVASVALAAAIAAVIVIGDLASGGASARRP